MLSSCTWHWDLVYSLERRTHDSYAALNNKFPLEAFFFTMAIF